MDPSHVYLSLSFYLSISFYLILYVSLSIYHSLYLSLYIFLSLSFWFDVGVHEYVYMYYVYIILYIYIIHDCIFFYLCNPYRLRGLFGDLDAGRWTRRTRRLRWHEKGIRRIRRSTIVAHLCPIRNKPRVKCFGRLAFCYQLLITHIGA